MPHSISRVLVKIRWTGLSITARLNIGFAIVLVCLGAMGVLNWFQTEAMVERTRVLASEDALRAARANDMQLSLQAMVIALNTLVWAEDPEDIKLQQKDFADALSRYEAAKSALVKMPTRSNAPAVWKQQFDEVSGLDESAIRIFKMLATEAPTMVQASRGGLYFQSLGVQASMVESLNKIRISLAQTMASSAEQAEREARLSQGITAGFAALALVGGMLSALLISRSISRPLKRAVELARTVAKGDLTAQVRTDQRDEIGALLNALADMQDGLRHLVGDIRQCADNIQVASTEVASGNTDLSQRTELTASNLQQTASSLEELTGAVRQSADSAGTANQLASTASAAAQRGGEVVQQVVTSMAEISTSSRKIAEITGVIDGIAFQTNLLALNAAVEAARAGEQGRGFAVVAGEVRNLAQRAASAAREIKSLIGASVERVESGTKLVQDAGGSMHEIVAAVQRVTDVISTITAAAAEQSSGIGQVNGAVVQLDQMTQQNAALVEESAAAAESLRDQAARLNGLVGAFRIAQST